MRFLSHPHIADPRRVGPVLGIAAVLMACALVVRRQTRKAEAACPPKGRFVEIDDLRLHWWAEGPADAEQTVVLLHGNGSFGIDFELSGLVALAQQRYRVIVVDRPGYGHSTRPPGRAWSPEQQAEAVLAALDRLGVVRPIVLGHSWGASVALAMGLAHPARVGALVLASGYHTPSLRLDVAWLSAPAWPLVGPLLRHTLSPVLGRLLWPLALRRLFAPAAPTAAFRQDYPVWMSLRPSQLAASAAESAMLIPMTWRLRSRQHTLEPPVVIVAGAQDRLLSTRWNSSALHGRLPASWLRIVEGSGHMVHHTATSQVMAAIDQAAALARAPRELGEHAAPVVGAGWRGRAATLPAG